MDNTRKKYVTFLTNTDRDADILAWLDTQENKSESIRAALRVAMLPRRDDITLADIYDELQEIKRTGLAVRGAGNGGDIAEPADVAANLDKLGL
jgi:hypothetical protein